MDSRALVQLTPLILVFSGVALVTCRTVFFPAHHVPTIYAYSFPETVSLPQWQFESSEVLTTEAVNQSEYVAGRVYRYSQVKATVEIEMRYLVNTDGDIEKFINRYLQLATPLNQEAIAIHRLEGIGSYVLFSDSQKFYLSSCINPHGESTVTDREFKHNRNFYDIRYRFFPWIFGEELKDERCLWTNISALTHNTSLVSAAPILERAWLSWYNRWSSSFPPR